MNYFDILLAKKLRGGGGDITIKSLNVTQNGTYSEEGVAYSPVIVNVPLPENAYLLKEIEDVEIATFTDGSDLPMPKLEVAIEPRQEGSGDPSPENVRPIIGWDEVNVTVADDTTDPTTENVYAIDLDGTRYGGKVDLVSGVLTVDRVGVDMGTLNWSYTLSSGRSIFTSNDITDYKHTGSNDIAVNAICECFTNVAMNTTFANGQMGMDGYETNHRTVICDNRYTDATSFKTAMNGVQLVYELDTPLTIQLSPTVVKSLRGMNNVFADTGNILDLSYLAKEE